MKDHEKRELVNRLRDIALKYHGHMCLRELIAREIFPVLEQDPVAWQAHYIDRDGNSAVYTTSNFGLAVENDINGTPIPLYPDPPQRPWQGLTDEEIKGVLETTHPENRWTIAERIEAKLKEKNNK